MFIGIEEVEIIEEYEFHYVVEYKDPIIDRKRRVNKKSKDRGFDILRDIYKNEILEYKVIYTDFFIL